MNKELEQVLKEMRTRKVNGDKLSPTLQAWADRIEEAVRQQELDTLGILYDYKQDVERAFRERTHYGCG